MKNLFIVMNGARLYFLNHIRVYPYRTKQVIQAHFYRFMWDITNKNYWLNKMIDLEFKK